MYEYAKSGQKQTTNNTTRKKATENVVSSKYQKSISDSMKTHFEYLPGFSFDDVLCTAIRGFIQSVLLSTPPIILFSVKWT